MSPLGAFGTTSGGHPDMSGVTLYLLVRDADGAVLAEFDSPASAVRALLDADRQLAGPGVSLMRYDNREGAVVATKSYVTSRLADLDRPRARPATRGRRARAT